MNVIVFSPHPDDAEVRMGGTIAQYARKGHNVSVVLVTVPNQKERRGEEAKKAAAILGAGLFVLDLDPYKLAFNRELVGIFDQVINGLEPDIIYTSWDCDSHQDHVAVTKASIAAARKNDCSLYMYSPSGFSPSAFKPQVFVDVSDTMGVKIKGILAHKSQAEERGLRWLRGIKARDAYFGYRIHAKYAEAFEVVWEIKRIQ